MLRQYIFGAIVDQLARQQNDAGCTNGETPAGRGVERTTKLGESADGIATPTESRTRHRIGVAHSLRLMARPCAVDPRGGLLPQLRERRLDPREDRGLTELG